MTLICVSCGRDINTVGQDLSDVARFLPGEAEPLCEDCVTDAFADRLVDDMFGQERHR